MSVVIWSRPGWYVPYKNVNGNLKWVLWTELWTPSKSVYLGSEEAARQFEERNS
jgi:hypothetical protein